jgi:catechol 2,3-dioxygenase-like lactoylglutathione lyase family enzyme
MPQYRFDHIHLYTPNPETTASWYEEMFGAEVKRATVDGKPRVTMNVGGTSVLLLQVPTLPTGQNSLDHFGLLVDDVDAAIADLRAKGVEVVMEPNDIRPGTRISFVRSPEGVRIEVLARS